MKTVNIENFQSHKKTELNLHQNINIIVGQSTSGKTAIFRAIEWLNSNRPLGTRFITHGEKHSTVRIDELVGTKTGKGKTSYKIKELEFDSGSGVPDVVRDYLALSEINIQNQLDEHFLITGSPGEVGRVFNKTLNIEQVDTWISILTKDYNTQKTLLDLNTDREKDLTNSIESLFYLDQMEALVSKTEANIRKVLNKKQQFSKLTDLLEDYKNNNKILDEKRKVLRRLKTAIVDITDDTLPKLKLQTKLFHLIERHSVYLDRIDSLRVSHTGIEYSLLPITNLMEKLRERREKLKGLANLIERFKNITGQLDYSKAKIEESKKHFDDSIHDYAVALGESKTCPVCLSKIDNIDHVIEELKKRYEIDPS